MRFRYYFVAVDLAGNAIEGAAVSVYLAGTTTPATIYLTRTSEQGISEVPQLYSDADGRVEFWVDSDDYDYGQLFKIVVEKEGLSFQVDDVQIIVWDAVKAVEAQSAVSAQDADKLGGQEGSYYLNRANHTGTQSPDTISPQGSGSGLDADMLESFHASQTPAANTIPVAKSDGKLDEGWLPAIGVTLQEVIAMAFLFGGD